LYFKSILKTVFQLFSYLPLALLHLLGSAIGFLAFALSSVYRRRLCENAAFAGYGWRTAWAAAVHAGQMVAELPRLWLGRPTAYAWADTAVMTNCWQQARTQGRGILILLPHLGCWEVVGHALADECMKLENGAAPLTAMYRPARQPWLDRIIRMSRERPNMRTVPADISGVRQVLKVLKAGQCTVVLPDQVPPMGMGVWGSWFGKQAYSMTLAAKLVQATQAHTLVCWGERLAWGRGYLVHAKPLTLDLSEPLEGVVQQINDAMEVAIRALPSQYLWGYARYKEPAKASI
jgi:KDO2-lipid IV(A) lauroyltransferase